LGRRDVLEYLLTLSGGYEMLGARDGDGRTPLYHAQNNKALHAWLVEEHRSSGTVMHQEERRPSEVSQIPDKYMPLLQQIEKEGWKSVHWKNNHTMLHWAAKHGYSDWCRYFIHLDADVSLQDHKNHTPLDIAREEGQTECASVLEEFKRKSSSFHSNSTRTSLANNSQRASQLGELGSQTMGLPSNSRPSLRGDDRQRTHTYASSRERSGTTETVF